MLIAQISDTHIANIGEKTYGIAPMDSNLVECVEHINQLEPKPDLVLVTGDICYSGSVSEARYAKQLLDELNYPYYIIGGNHDERKNLISVFGGGAIPANDNGFINYVIEGHEVRLIAMDSVDEGKSGGKICQQRATWLSEKLDEEKSKPTIIFIHHPPTNFGVLETDVDGFENVELLAKIVVKNNNIERIICGHIHLQAFVKWQGTIVSTAPCMGMRLLLDLTMKKPSQFILEDPAYQLHYFSPEKSLITHTVHVRQIDGPYLFKEQFKASKSKEIL